MPHKVLRADQPSWNLTWAASGQIRKVNGILPTDPSSLTSLFDTIGHTAFIPAQRSSTEFHSSGPTVGLDIESRIDAQLDILLRARPFLRQTLGVDQLRNLQRDFMQSLAPTFAKRGELMLTDVSLVSDEPVIQEIINLDYAAYRENRPEKRSLIEKVSQVTSDITEGFPVRFAGVTEDSMGFIPEFNTPDGQIPLNILSQGTQSLFHWISRLLFGYGEFYDFPSDLSDKPGVLIIDEIDAHLHPSWQRRIIPTLVHHFPSLQIFCSTHSPLMLAGLGPKSSSTPSTRRRRRHHGVYKRI